MTAPFLRSTGAVAGTLTATLQLPVGANAVGDLAVVYVKGAPGAVSTGSPVFASTFTEVYRYDGPTMYEAVAWVKVPPSGLTSVTVTAGTGQNISFGWWGFVEVFGNVAYPEYGWLDVPGVAGSYGTFTRTALPSGIASVGMFARVRLGTTGINQLIAGWGSLDAALLLTSANTLIAYVNDTSGVPIGNVASPTPLPNLTGEIWVGAEITVDSAVCNYYYRDDDVNEIEAIYDLAGWTLVGPVYGTNHSQVARVSNSGTILLGGGPSSSAFNGDILAYHEYSPIGTLVTSINMSDPAHGVTAGGTSQAIVPTTERGTRTPIEEYDYSIPDTMGTPSIPARHVYGPDRLIYQNFLMEYVGGDTTGDIVPPETWSEAIPRSAIVGTRRIRVEAFTLPTSTATPDIAVQSSGGYSVSFFALVIRGLTTPTRPPLYPVSPRMTLGCADSYNLFITDQTYRQRVEQVAWTRLKWERVLDDISKASATIPDRYGGVNCLAEIGGLVPWQYGLLIERNDQEVWQGPIINVSRKGSDIQVDAADVLIRYQKRLLARGLSFEYEQADAGLVFADIIKTHAFLGSDAWELAAPQVTTGVPITRALRPRELKMAWDLMSELTDDAVDMYMMNGVLYVWEPNSGWCYQADRRRVLDGPYNVNYDLVYGMFTEDAWSERPDWSIDGPGQANYVAVPGVDSGEFGFRRIEIVENAVSQARYGVLDYVDADRVELPEDVHPTLEDAALRNRANTVIALRAFAPAVISGGVLAETAPINVAHLRPGSIWRIDIWDHGFGQLLTAGRLRRVEGDVTVEQSGLREQLSVTLTPVGWETEDG